MRSIVGRLDSPRRWREGIGRRGFHLCERLAPGVAVTVRYVAPTTADGSGPAAPNAVAFDRWRADDPSIPADVPTSLDATDVVVGATMAGDLVGHCIVSPRPVRDGQSGSREQIVVSLWDLYVEPAYRSRGLGRTLLWRARTDGAVADADRVEALVAASNEGSRRAFRAAGFEPAERVISVGWGERTYRRRRLLAPDDGG